MSEYIIRNCPCFNEGNPMLDYYGECLSLTDDVQVCQDCTDCKLKQIVEKCKLFQNNYLVNDGVQLLTTNILNSLDIQEVE